MIYSVLTDLACTRSIRMEGAFFPKKKTPRIHKGYGVFRAGNHQTETGLPYDFLRYC